MRQNFKNLKSKRFCIHFTDYFHFFFSKIDQIVFNLYGFRFIFFLQKKIHRAKSICPILIKFSQLIGLIPTYNIFKFHWAIYYRTGDMAPPDVGLKV